MFSDLNKVTLLGNVTNDPDLRFTPSGSAVLSFGLATNRRYKKGDEWTDDVTFHNIVVWGQQAQSLSQRISKGTRLIMTGRITTRSWDGTDGKKNYKTEIVADEISLVSRYKEGPASELPPVAASSGSAEDKPARRAKSSDEAPAAEPTVEINPDDLPF